MIWLLAACSSPAPTPASTHTAVYSPGFALVSEEALRSHMGGSSSTARIYNFWATWCGPCVQEMPVLKEAASSLSADVILVNIDHHAVTDTSVKPFLKKHTLEHLMNVQLRSDDPIPALAGIIPEWNDQIPVTLVTKANGEIAASFSQSVTLRQLQESVHDAARR